MNTALQILNSVFLVAALGVLLKLYAEHVEVKIKVTALWNWWVKTYDSGQKP